MEKILDRVSEYLFRTGISEVAFTTKAGISVGCFSIHRRKGTDLSLVNVNKIIEAYPEINRNWLIWGEGEMLNNSNDKVVINSNASKNSTSNVNIRDINSHASAPDNALNTLMQTLQAQQQITLQAQEMALSMQKQNDKLIDIIGRTKPEANEL